MSHEQYPWVSRKDTKLEIFLKAPENSQERSVETTFALDLNTEGGVIGIEIINLKYVAGPNVLAGYDWDFEKSKEGIHVSYDEDADAFYITLSSDRSVEQGVVEGKLVLDSGGRIIRLECDPSVCQRE